MPWRLRPAVVFERLPRRSCRSRRQRTTGSTAPRSAAPSRAALTRTHARRASRFFVLGAITVAAAASDCAAVPSICTSASKVTTVASLLFTCPNTSRKLSTGVEMDVPGLRAHWNSTLRLDCPHCRGVHDISVRQVYMDAALEGLDQSRLILSRNSGARARKAIITARSRPGLSHGSGTAAG
jgi:hypothetical protein